MDDAGSLAPLSEPVAWLTLTALIAAGQGINPDPARGERIGIGLDAHGIFGGAGDLNLRHAIQHRNLARQEIGVIDRVVNRQGIGGRDHEEDRLVAGIDLAIGRRRNHRRGQLARRRRIAACTSCAAASMFRSSLNWMVMLVEPSGFATSSGRCPARSRRLFQRRRDRRRHGLRIGARPGWR